MFTQQINQYSYDFFYSLNNRENLDLYFKFKNKYEYSMNSDEYLNFSQDILNKLDTNIHWNNADIIVIPETGNANFIKLVESTNKKIITLKKASKENIKSYLDKQPMMKAEKAKLFTSIEEMTTIKIANIAGNQRKRFIECLFDTNSLAELKNINCKNIVFMDDSIFSGFTFLAAQYCLSHVSHHNIILFDKQN